MSRTTGAINRWANTTKEEKLKYNILKSYHATLNSLEKQAKLGNLNEEGQAILKEHNKQMSKLRKQKGSDFDFNISNIDKLGDKSSMMKIIMQSYQDPRYKDSPNKAKKLTEDFSRTGTIATERVSRKTGKTYVAYGREVNRAYKAAKEIAGKSKSLSVGFETITGKDANGNLIFGEKTYNIDVTNKDAFVASIENKSALIAIRIAAGEDREEVLADYGY